MAVREPKVAIVCDWLTVPGGAERVVLSLAKAFPGAPIYTSVFTPETMPAFAGLDIRTTYLQKLPKKLRGRHQLFPLQRANAFKKLDLSEYDIIISSASAEAKAVQKRPGALHICYCHTPTRYYWSHYNEYLAEPGFGKMLNSAVRVALPMLVRLMRRIDLRAVKGVDDFIANSSVTADRIRRFYHRTATVIHPPVDMTRFRHLPLNEPRNGFVVVGRQVPYKRMDLAIEACKKLGVPLTLLGDGPQHDKLMAMAGSNTTFVRNGDDEHVANALIRAEAFLAPQEEDFGIVQIEAMAAGTPVIAYGKSGALDAVVEGKTGLFFTEQTVANLVGAIKRFKAKTFDPETIHKHAETFSEERFIQQMQNFVAEKWAAANRTILD